MSVNWNQKIVQLFDEYEDEDRKLSVAKDDFKQLRILYLATMRRHILETILKVGKSDVCPKKLNDFSVRMQWRNVIEESNHEWVKFLLDSLKNCSPQETEDLILRTTSVCERVIRRFMMGIESTKEIFHFDGGKPVYNCLENLRKMMGLKVLY